MSEGSKVEKKKSVHPPKRKVEKHTVCFCPVCGELPKVYPYKKEDIYRSVVECGNEKCKGRIIARGASVKFAVENWNRMVESHTLRKDGNERDILGDIAVRRLGYLCAHGMIEEDVRLNLQSFRDGFLRHAREIEKKRAEAEREFNAVVAKLAEEQKAAYAAVVEKIFGKEHEKYRICRGEVTETYL